MLDLRTLRSAALSGQGVIPQTGVRTKQAAEVANDEFSKMLQGILSSSVGEQVSEEALFAAITIERVKSLKGEELGKQYEALLKQTQTSMAKGNYVPYEDAARVALKNFRDQGKLTLDEADQIHSQAFGAAQLDVNKSALYDDYAGANDSTKAVMTMAAAIASAKLTVDKYKSGQESAVTRTLNSGFSASGAPLVNPYDTGVGAYGKGNIGTGAPIPSAVHSPRGRVMDGPEGFLFKPKSDHGGKLCVLLPGGELSRQAQSLVLKDSSGRVIEEGYHWAPGFGAEGDPMMARKKFNFKKHGSEYPDGLVVEARLKNGNTIQWKIPDPARRYD